VDELAALLGSRGIDHIHASVSHEGGMAFAVVILEGTTHHL
jgi:phosphopantetheinyl transferase (holo-ACP synthase)